MIASPELVLPTPAQALRDPVAYATYASQGAWRPAGLHFLIGDGLERLVRGEALRNVYSAPPRHGKSELISRYFVSWWLGSFPSTKVMLVSAVDRHAQKYGRHIRNDLHKHGPRLWGVDVNPRASVKSWEVLQGGRPTGGTFFASGIGGSLPGEGADLLVVDDTVRTVAEAKNETIRQGHWEWFESVFARLHPPGRVVVLQTRWHEDDIIGRLQQRAKDGVDLIPWHFVNVPALAEENDPLGRAVGEALWPEKGFTREWLLAQKASVGPYMWECNYCGRPAPLTGSIYKRAWFRYYEYRGDYVTVPDRGTCKIADLHQFATADLATSKKTRADWSVIGRWGYHPTWKVLLLLDVFRARLDGPELVPALEAVHQAGASTVYVERMRGELQRRVGDVVKEALRAGVPVVELEPNGDKEARALATSGPLAAGQVYFREKAEWLPALEAELLTFPGKHDDQVDVVGYGIGVFQDRVTHGRRPVAESTVSPERRIRRRY